MEQTDEGWALVGVVVDGDRLEVGGVNVWERGWESLGRHITVADPLYPQRHQLAVYSISSDDGPVIFAAGEFSANVWGFYIPASHTGDH